MEYEEKIIVSGRVQALLNRYKSMQEIIKHKRIMTFPDIEIPLTEDQIEALTESAKKILDEVKAEIKKLGEK